MSTRRPLLLSLIAALALHQPAMSAQNASAPDAVAPAAPAWAPALDSLVLRELARTRTPGAQLAVVRDGRVVYTRGYGVADAETGRAVTAQTLFRVGSVTKMFTGATLAWLAANDRIDLHAPIERYVPELAGKRVGTVTTHQLLTHSAGWHDEARPYGRMGEGALGEVMREITDTLFFTDPGRTMSYSNPGYSMAGYVAEQAGGARFGTLAEERVLRPLGMTRATFRPLVALTYDVSQGHVGAPGADATVVRPYTENTAQWAAGFLFASAGELGRFAIALMDGGRIDGRAVMDTAIVRALTTGYVDVPGDGDRYGYGLVVGTRATTTGAERVWEHGGAITGFDARVVMFPDRRAAFIWVDNRGGAPPSGIDALLPTVLGTGVIREPAPPAPRDPTAADRAAFAGTYRQGRTQFVLVDSAGGLFVEQRGQGVRAQLVGDDRLLLREPNGARQTLRYRRDADGRVAFLYVGVRALARQ